MTVQLSPDEVREAIREWFTRRGVDVTDQQITFSKSAITGSPIVTEISGVELPMATVGPYR